MAPTCYPEHGAVRGVELEDGEWLLPLPGLQGRPGNLHPPGPSPPPPRHPQHLPVTARSTLSPPHSAGAPPPSSAPSRVFRRLLLSPFPPADPFSAFRRVTSSSFSALLLQQLRHPAVSRRYCPHPPTVTPAPWLLPAGRALRLSKRYAE